MSATGDHLIGAQVLALFGPVSLGSNGPGIYEAPVLQGRYRCPLHPRRDVTWRGRGCQDCDRDAAERRAERAERAAARRKRKAARSCR